MNNTTEDTNPTIINLCYSPTALNFEQTPPDYVKRVHHLTGLAYSTDYVVVKDEYFTDESSPSTRHHIIARRKQESGEK